MKEIKEAARRFRELFSGPDGLYLCVFSMEMFDPTPLKSLSGERLRSMGLQMSEQSSSVAWYKDFGEDRLFFRPQGSSEWIRKGAYDNVIVPPQVETLGQLNAFIFSVCGEVL